MNYIVKDYWIRNANKMGISLKTYLDNAKYNYVVIDGDFPLVWSGEYEPVIFGGKEDAIESIQNFVTNITIDENTDINLMGWYIWTEWEFIYRFCKSTLEEVLKEYTIKKGEDDGNGSKIFYLSNMNGVINFNNGEYTDILYLIVGIDELLSVFITDNEDKHQCFENIDILEDEVIYNILMQVLDYDM